jgi:ATP-dependent Lon protease
MPVIPSGTNVVYPQQLMPVMAVDPRDVAAIDEAASSEGKYLAIFSQAEPEEGAEDDGLRLREIGTAAGVVRMAKAPDGAVHAILQGRARLRLVEVLDEGPPVHARVELLEDRHTRARGRDARRQRVVRPRR